MPHDVSELPVLWLHAGLRELFKAGTAIAGVTRSPRCREAETGEAAPLIHPWLFKYTCMHPTCIMHRLPHCSELILPRHASAPCPVPSCSEHVVSGSLVAHACRCMLDNAFGADWMRMQAYAGRFVEILHARFS
jgi:hypothetical protein